MDAVEELIADIHEAFKAVRRGQRTLHEADFLDNPMSAKVDWGEIRTKLDTEGRWLRIPDAHIEECSSALSFVDSVSWKYYVPAYMVWTLKNFRSSSSMSVDHTIYTFDLAEDGDLREWQLNRYKMLDRPQTECVTSFLRFMSLQDRYADARVAKSALEGFWENHVKQLAETEVAKPKIKRKNRRRSH